MQFDVRAKRPQPTAMQSDDATSRPRPLPESAASHDADCDNHLAKQNRMASWQHPSVDLPAMQPPTGLDSNCIAANPGACIHIWSAQVCKQDSIVGQHKVSSAQLQQLLGPVQLHDSPPLAALQPGGPRPQSAAAQQQRGASAELQQADSAHRAALQKPSMVSSAGGVLQHGVQQGDSTGADVAVTAPAAPDAACPAAEPASRYR